MGVTGLWPLLEPVGRRISIEALQNKWLAIGECPGVWSRAELARPTAAAAAALLAHATCPPPLPPPPLSRCLRMAVSVHPRHARRQGRPHTQRTHTGLLSPHLPVGWGGACRGPLGRRPTHPGGVRVLASPQRQAAAGPCSVHRAMRLLSPSLSDDPLLPSTAHVAVPPHPNPPPAALPTNAV